MRRVAEHRTRPRRIDGLLVEDRRQHLAADGLQERVDRDRNRNRRSLPRPRGAGHGAKRCVREPGGGRGDDHADRARKQAAQRPDALRVGERARDDAERGHEQRGIGAEAEQRGEIADEIERHRAALVGERRAPGKGGSEDGNEEQRAEFRGAIGLRRPNQPEEIHPVIRASGGPAVPRRVTREVTAN
jgi:hypothetical protein